MLKYAIKNQRTGLYAITQDKGSYTSCLEHADLFAFEEVAERARLEDEKVILVETTVKEVK